MAINFPSNPTNAQEVTEGNVTYVYNATKGYWESSEVSSGASIDVLADLTALIAKTGMSNGDQAFVTGNNNLYIYSGTGWYKIATVQNDSPTAITGVSGSYSLETDGTPTVITAVSTDPEGFPLTWSYSTSGLGSIATVSQTDNVFTITPSTDDANIGTFTLTINATDGVNGAVSANTSITLQFYIANSNYTTLLATAVDTSDNNNITDSSVNNHTITVNGDAIAGTFSPYRHGGYSAYFDGVDSRLFIPNNELEITTQDFTIEAWINFEIGLITIQVASNGEWLTGDNVGYSFRIQTSGKIQLSGSVGVWNSSSIFYTSTNSVPSNEWAHIAICRESGVISSYINGIKDPTTANYSSSLNQLGDNDGTANVGYSYVGAYIADNTVTGVPTGYMADFHFKLGSAKYNSNFDVPTERLTAEAGTTILLFNDNTIKDNSTNSFTVTPLGGISLPPRGPFDNLQYSTGIHGGSVYFDGSGDYLSVPDDASLDLGTGDFTLEAWVRMDSTSGNRIIFERYTSGNNGSFQLYYRGTGNSIAFWTVADGVIAQDPSSSTIKVGFWHHIVATRESGTLKLYVDGSQVASASCTTNFDSTLSLTVGAQVSTGTNYFGGYISDCRIVKGTAVYTSNFTPPTAPLTAITNTSLLLSGTDASVIDKSQTNNLQLVGNTTGSTTQAKFANTKSMYFDGSGDYVSIASNPAFGFGTGDFTIEFWTYWGGTLNTGNGGAFVGLRSAVAAEALVVYLSTSGEIMFYDGPANVEVGSGVTITQEWTHIALTRESGLWRIFVNGTLGATRNSSTDLGSSKPCRIGQAVNGTTTSYHGYIQDLRVTKGLARYTANFTPPTEPLKG